jgi:hypothetical protein
MQEFHDPLTTSSPALSSAEATSDTDYDDGAEDDYDDYSDPQNNYQP